MSAHILVVEDEPAIAESVAYALRRDGFSVSLAGNLAEAEVERDRADLDLITRFRQGARGLPWRLLPSATAIQPLVVGDGRAAMDVAGALGERGFWVPAIRPPTVPQGTARLRVSLSAAHSTDDVAALLAALHAVAAEGIAT